MRYWHDCREGAVGKRENTVSRRKGCNWAQEKERAGLNRRSAGGKGRRKGEGGWPEVETTHSEIEWG